MDVRRSIMGPSARKLARIAKTNVIMLQVYVSTVRRATGGNTAHGIVPARASLLYNRTCVTEEQGSVRWAV